MCHFGSVKLSLGNIVTQHLFRLVWIYCKGKHVNDKWSVCPTVIYFKDVL